jgi:hypothetical protein
MDKILKLAELLVKAAPIALQSVENAKPFALTLYNTLAKGQKLTESDLDIIENRIKELSAELQKPLDPE